MKVNITSCQVSPDELGKYLRRGIKISTVHDLHAKVFVLGGTVVVGSTNVSWSSENRLREAVVVTRDRSVVASARRFIEDIDSFPVTKWWLRECRRIYKKPTFGKRQ